MIRYVLLLLAANAAEAQMRRAVRLDDPGFSMEHVVVRNQRSIGDCYAHAAAQFYDAWRFKLGDTDYRRQSSGLEINQYFKWQRKKEKIDGGKLQKIVPKLSVEGTCAESDLNEKLIGITIDDYAHEVMEIYRRQQREFHKVVDPLLKVIPPVSNRFQYLMAQRLERQIKEEHLPLFVKAGINELKTLHVKYMDPKYLKVLNQDARLQVVIEDMDDAEDVVKIFERIGTLSCNGQRMLTAKPFRVDDQLHMTLGIQTIHTPLGIPTFVPYLKYQTSEFLKRVHNEFDYYKDAMPIGIGYCSAVLSEGRAYKYREPMLDKTCGNHASLLIGRRPHPTIPGLHQLLIRNTWGWARNTRQNPEAEKRWCRSYHADWGCDAPRGSVWIDEDVLASATYQSQVFVR